MPDGLDLFDIDGAFARVMEAYRTLPLTGRFGDQRPSPQQLIGVGDVLDLTIFEAAAGGLFSTSNGTIGGGSKHTALPSQEVGQSGTVMVPYVGRVVVTGKTPEQVEKMVVDHLRDKAIEPQVVVTVRTARSKQITVNGEVGHPGLYITPPRGQRLMDLLAAAGGVKGDPKDVFVRLTRKDKSAVVPLRTIVEDRSQDIWVWPADQIYVYKEAQIFTAFGATGRSGNFQLVYERTTLAEAIGDASGLNDSRAAPAGVFLFRQERSEVVCALKHETPCRDTDGVRPVVYRLDLSNPVGITLAQRIPIRNGDVLYVADASSVQLLKFLSLLESFGTMTNQVSTTANRIHHWR